MLKPHSKVFFFIFTVYITPALFCSSGNEIFVFSLSLVLSFPNYIALFQVSYMASLYPVSCAPIGHPLILCTGKLGILDYSYFLECDRLWSVPVFRTDLDSSYTIVSFILLGDRKKLIEEEAGGMRLSEYLMSTCPVWIAPVMSLLHWAETLDYGASVLCEG